MIRIEVANLQDGLPLSKKRICEAVELVFHQSGIARAEVSVAVVDDPAMRTLHQKYLNHDCPTDVLSFVLEETEDCVEGEVIVSADTATAAAPEYGWAAQDELLLYVIHGALHLVGYRDGTPRQRAEMRVREAACLAALGLTCDGPRSASPGRKRRSTRTGFGSKAKR